MSSSEQVSKAELLRLRLAEGGGGSGENGPIHCGDAPDWPNILEILDGRLNPKGVKGGRLGLYLDKGIVQVCVNWPAAKAFGFVRVHRLAVALQDVESALADPEFKWLPDKPRKGF